MKQYTTPEQTAKLIELGFAPKMRIKGVCTRYGTVNVEHETNFDVGELFEMLPKHIFPNGKCCDFHICANQNLWVVKYIAVLYETDYRFCSTELIDALYNMIIMLKEEGVI